MIVGSRRIARGFTLIELSVVVLILALLAAAIVPKLTAFRSGADERAFTAKLPALAETARSRAMTRGGIVTLAFSDSDRSFSLQNDDQDAGESVLTAPESAVLETTRVGTADTAGGDWSIRFFGDGSSEGGAIEFSFDGALRTMVVDGKTGRAQWVDGAMPDLTNQRWQAGELELRGQTEPRP